MAVTLKDISKQVGVSISTVSRVISGDHTRPIKKETEDRIWEIVGKLGYVKGGKSRTTARGNCKIGCILNSKYEKYNDPFFSRLFTSIENELKKYDYTIDFANVYTYDELTDITTFNGIITNGKVEGLILLSEIPIETVRKFKQRMQNIVCITDMYDYMENEVDCIGIDSRKAIMDVVDYLVDKGHRDIAFFNGNYENYLNEGIRVKSYRQGLIQNGIQIKENIILKGNYDFKDGYHMMETLWDKVKVTAVIAVNDKMALGALSYLNNLDIKVPDEVAVVGFDDIDMARYSNPPLTTIHLPVEELGRMAVITYMHRKNNELGVPLTVMLPCSLVKRNTA